MSRIQSVEYENLPPGKNRELLDQVKSKLGKIPNIFKHMALSPAVLESYLGFSATISGTSLSAKIREQIALTVAQENNCGYCLAAHTALAKGAGINDTQITDSRRGTSEIPKTAATLRLAQKLVRDKARLTDADLKDAFNAGLSDAEIIEIVAVVALNLFTNYFNHVVDPEIDFPKA
jgi:uncharacterized peroxidase-related enzyme